MQFVRECWAELQRVEWPDRRQLWQATGVVILVCIVIGVYLAVIDAGLTRVSAWLVRQYANH
jgi:preprotein translocase subunit SecE